MKNKIIVLIGLIMVAFALFGCEKQYKQSPLYVSIVYEGRAYSTTPVDYKYKGTKKHSDETLGNIYIKIKQGAQAQCRVTNLYSDESKCTLTIQKSDTKEKIKEVVLNNNDLNNLDTSIPKGKYIYSFSMDWKNGSAKFIGLIEIE
jgi:hypothetical protein